VSAANRSEEVTAVSVRVQRLGPAHVIVALLVASLVLTACGDGDEQVIPTSTSPTSTSTSTSPTSSPTSTSTSVVVESGDAEVCRTAQVFASAPSGQNTADAAELARVAPRAANGQLRAAASELGRAGAGWGVGHDAAIETISTECNDLGIYVQFP
jgi:hypothetical protein